MEKPIIEKAIRGTLKFLVFNRFYGFITRFDTREDIFVHGSEIRYINPMQFTRRCGDSVIFDLAVGVKGLEAVNVILNLTETEEEELCNEKDSIYLFDNMNGKFQKLAGGKQPGPIIMKKRNVLSPRLDESETGTEIESSLYTFPSLSSLSKYPSMSTLSSISYDDSILSWAPPVEKKTFQPLSVPIIKLSELQDDSIVEDGKLTEELIKRGCHNGMGDAGTDIENEGMENFPQHDLDSEESKDVIADVKLTPIFDRINFDFPDKLDAEDKDFMKKKIPLSELRGKSYRKMHEENMKRKLTTAFES